MNMGFDVSGDHLVSNDDYYNRIEEVDGEYKGKYYYEPKGDSDKDLYENHISEDPLKITGIIRPKKDSPNPLYKTILFYHP